MSFNIAVASLLLLAPPRRCSNCQLVQGSIPSRPAFRFECSKLFQMALTSLGESLEGYGSSVGGHMRSVGGHGSSVGGHGRLVEGHGILVGGHWEIMGGDGSLVGGHGMRPSLCEGFKIRRVVWSQR